MERFWAKVDRSGECWPWEAATNAKGYGIFWYEKASRMAHRVAYEMSRGPVPDGYEVDHKCWNRTCVRPEHLRLVKHSENTQNRSGARRGSSSGRRGVSIHPSGRWQAQVGTGGKNLYLGLFESPETASAVVADWRRENMPYSLMDQEKEAS